MAAPSTGSEEEPGQQPGLSPGDCADADSGALAHVPCDMSHHFEVIPASHGCSLADAYAYLGGDPDTDVLRPDLLVQQREGICVLGIPGTTVETTFEGALHLDDAPALRECHDRITNQFVPCAEPHTGEVVQRMEKGKTEPLDCETRAESYMRTSLDRVFRNLKVTSFPGDVRRCVAELRDGTKYLTSSLRNIGSGSIRTEPIG